MHCSQIKEACPDQSIINTSQVDNRKNNSHQAGSHQGGLSSDRVSFSEEAMALARESSPTPEPGKTDAQTAARQDLPLDYYSVPGWLADLSPVVLQHVDLSNGPVPYENLFKRGYGIREKHPDELKEYNQLIREYYQEVLQEEGISGTQDHYQSLIVNQESSEMLRQKMHQKILDDPRAVELAQLFQINLG
ncbi:hypothetical protein [Desulfonatronovibrio hydrogenovorans]|uniref:hypothetical protein n=1 Tax=Desulfonatronovibrio hydrogenovorans TaxID=53245 RepID=UPI00048D0EED|nr:hypothetical protein [Desulfonatronovibrio hydrogenovorans]